MKIVSKISIFVILAGVILGGCSKSNEEMVTSEPAAKSQDLGYIQSPEGMAALANILSEYTDQSQLKNGAEFITPFFFSQGFITTRDLVFDPNIGIVSGELSLFFAEYGEGDFWRINPDGTVTVHLVSNEAMAIYEDFGAGLSLSGENNHMTMNYSGELVEVPVPFPPFVLYFINITNPPAMVFKGNGRVQENGAGPIYTLLASTVSSGNGNAKSTLKLN